MRIDDKTREALGDVSDIINPMFAQVRLRWMLECKRRGLRPDLAMAAFLDFTTFTALQQITVAAGLPLEQMHQISHEWYHDILEHIQEFVMNAVSAKINTLQNEAN